MGFFDFLKDSGSSSSCTNQASGWFDVDKGQVYLYQNANSRRCVYSQSPKAVKVLASPDGKRVLVLRENGSVCILTPPGYGMRVVYNERDSLGAQDIVWNGNNAFQIKNGNGWRKRSI